MTREASDLLHEIEKQSIIQQAGHLRGRVEALGVTLEALRDLVLALGPMFYIRRKTVEKPLDVKTIVAHALLLNQGQIEENRILVDVRESEGPLTVTMRRGALTQVFNNLIDNACYWLSRKSEEDDRRLRIVVSADERSVLFADNGPGIDPRDEHRIFDVFFSTKIDGRGLGLFIAVRRWQRHSLRLHCSDPASILRRSGLGQHSKSSSQYRMLRRMADSEPESCPAH